jgi:hypothetical protein
MLAKWLLCIAFAALALIALPWFSVWLHFVILCTGNEAAAERMRALDDDAFERLYRETESMVAARRRSDSLDFVVPADALPAAAKVIGARYASMYGHDVSFNLSGCYDDKVFLNVTVGDGDRPAEISLSPGDARNSEALWRKGAPGPLR